MSAGGGLFRPARAGARPAAAPGLYYHSSRSRLRRVGSLSLERMSLARLTQRPHAVNLEALREIATRRDHRERPTCCASRKVAERVPAAHDPQRVVLRPDPVPGVWRGWRGNAMMQLPPEPRTPPSNLATGTTLRGGPCAIWLKVGAASQRDRLYGTTGSLSAAALCRVTTSAPCKIIP